MNGCHNRAPFATEQVLHGIDSRTCEPITVVIPNVMSKDCQYTLHDKYADKGCVGCIHKSTPHQAGIPTAQDRGNCPVRPSARTSPSIGSKCEGHHTAAQQCVKPLCGQPIKE